MLDTPSETSIGESMPGELMRGFDVDETDFRRYVAMKLAAQSDPALRLKVADLYLAYACLGKDTRALKSFEERHFPVVRKTLSRMRMNPATAEEFQGAF